MTAITINTEQSLYVIPAGHGYSCYGFDVLERKTTRLASWITARDPSFDIPMPAPRGTLERYAQWEMFCQKARAMCDANKIRCDIELTKQLIGLEGKRVEVTLPDGSRERYNVGKSTGWVPCHLAIKTRRSLGGAAVYFPDGATVRVIS
jgi:hypothetical protein